VSFLSTYRQRRSMKVVLLLLVVTLCLLLGACSTTQQPRASLPQPPAVLMVPPPTKLKSLPTTEPSPRQAATTVIENYGTYHETAARLRALQQWVTEQFNPTGVR